MEEAEEVGWVERAKQAGNRHTQKLPCSIWAVPTCVRRYLAPDLNGRIGGRGRKNWRQMHHADEGAATPVATEGRGEGGDTETLRTGASKHSNQLREPLHLHNLHAT